MRELHVIIGQTTHDIRSHIENVVIQSVRQVKPIPEKTFKINTFRTNANNKNNHHPSRFGSR